MVEHILTAIAAFRFFRSPDTADDGGNIQYCPFRGTQADAAVRARELIRVRECDETSLWTAERLITHLDRADRSVVTLDRRISQAYLSDNKHLPRCTPVDGASTLCWPG
jgi:hypothetical protein